MNHLAAAKARSYLLDLPAVGSDEAGKAHLFKLAMTLVKGFDLTPECAFRLFVEAYNPRCQPPWEEEQIKRMVYGARLSRSYYAPPGYMVRSKKVRILDFRTRHTPFGKKSTEETGGTTAVAPPTAAEE